MLETISDKNDRIATNMRTLLILEIVGNSAKPLTATEINDSLGVPKQTIHRLCQTLIEQGFLVYEPDGRHLRPARRLRNLAAGVLHSSRTHIARHQILQQIAQQVGETVNFVVPEDDGMNYIDRIETNWAFRVQLPIGTHVPFHCTASGKTFLASMRPGARRNLLKALKLEQLTPNTKTDLDQLDTELSIIAKNGYAIDREEFMEGMIAIAVPVVDEQGRFLASLAFHGPTVRLTEQILLDHKPTLIAGAAQLAATLSAD